MPKFKSLINARCEVKGKEISLQKGIACEISNDQMNASSYLSSLVKQGCLVEEVKAPAAKEAPKAPEAPKAKTSEKSADKK